MPRVAEPNQNAASDQSAAEDKKAAQSARKIMQKTPEAAAPPTTADNKTPLAVPDAARGWVQDQVYKRLLAVAEWGKEEERSIGSKFVGGVFAQVTDAKYAYDPVVTKGIAQDSRNIEVVATIRFSDGGGNSVTERVTTGRVNVRLLGKSTEPLEEEIAPAREPAKDEEMTKAAEAAYQAPQKPVGPTRYECAEGTPQFRWFA